MGFLKNNDLLERFGKRLRQFRDSIDISQEQVHYATGISQSHIARIELGKLNVGLSHLSLLGELFGLSPHEILNFSYPIPEQDQLKKNVIKYLKRNGMNPEVILKPSAIHVVVTKVLPSKFLNSAKFGIEIVDYCKEKYQIDFTTPQISKALSGLVKKGLIEKIASDKKSKFRYKKR